MERKFIIKLYKDYDWEIKIKTLSDYALYPELGLDIFAIERQTDNKKIVYLFDADIDLKSIALVKDNESFTEACKFEYIYNEAGEDKKSEFFDGTFIDALELIEKEFNKE